MSSSIGEPFQLYLSSTLSQRTPTCQAIYVSLNHDFPGYVTVTAQSDGIHVWDLQNLHPAASYSVGEHIIFSTPTFTRYLNEDGNKSVVSYVGLASAPDLVEQHCWRTIWVVQQSLSSPSITANVKTVILVDEAIARICGSGHDTIPLFLVGRAGTLFLANAQVDVKARLDWPGDRIHVETFVFAKKSCTIVQDITESCTSVAVICYQSGRVLQVQVILLGEDMIPAGTCEVPIGSSLYNVGVLWVTCSSSGVLSFIDAFGVWATYQLVSWKGSSVLAPFSENLHLRWFTTTHGAPVTKDSFSAVSLGTSLVLLAGLLEKGKAVSLQIWDLAYGVVLSTQTILLSSALPWGQLSLAIADKDQALLTISPPLIRDGNDAPRRSSIHVVPVDGQLRSSLAGALGKMTQTVEWLAVKKPSRVLDERGVVKQITSGIRASLKVNNAVTAERGFLTWVTETNKGAALGYEMVKEALKTVLIVDPSTKYAYAPRIIRYLLENAVVSTIMLDGRLLTALRERGDWENMMFALTVVKDISEDELMSSVKFLIGRKRRDENTMNVDASDGYVPPLWTYLSACLSYSFSSTPMRLAIRRQLPDAQDLVVILEVLEVWLQGGTEQEMETLLKSVALNVDMQLGSADSPPYFKMITFLLALLDASFVTLLQYRPSHDVLRRILSYIEPEIAFIDGLEPLRGMLEPFAKAQMLKEKSSRTRETASEWRNRKMQLMQQADLDVGLYRLEELVI